MLISVVIPAFNVENCISRSIESVLRQKFSDIELIIVDDGSSDDTGFICDKFKTIDSRIKVIHQKNSGVSEARNTGIINSTGDYLFFLDADDWLSLDYFISVYHLLKLKQYSFVFTPYYEVPKNSLYIHMFNFSDTMIFEKSNPIPQNHNRYEQCFEYMFIFSKGRPKTFNPIKVPTKNAPESPNHAQKSKYTIKNTPGR